MSVDKWDWRFYYMAETVSTWSKDPTCCVGAVIVSPDRRRLSCGYNGFPRGVADLQSRLDQAANKNRLTIHAELNAILNAATDVKGWTLYSTKFPCTDCALTIIQSGVVKVMSNPVDMDGDWWPDQRHARALLREAGVELCTTMEAVPNEV